MNDKKWRAIGIEEVNDEQAVPGIVCWFTRGWASEEAAHVRFAQLDA